MINPMVNQHLADMQYGAIRALSAFADRLEELIAEGKGTDPVALARTFAADIAKPYDEDPDENLLP